MSLLATPGSPQNGTVDPEREGTCQSLSWMVGGYSGFGPCDEHFPQLAHLMISWPLLNKAIPMHFGIWLKLPKKTPITRHYLAFLCLWVFWQPQDPCKMALWLQSLKGLKDHVSVWAGWWAGPLNLGHVMSISPNLLMWWNLDHFARALTSTP